MNKEEKEQYTPELLERLKLWGVVVKTNSKTSLSGVLLKTETGWQVKSRTGSTVDFTVSDIAEIETMDGTTIIYLSLPPIEFAEFEDEPEREPMNIVYAILGFCLLGVMIVLAAWMMTKTYL